MGSSSSRRRLPMTSSIRNLVEAGRTRPADAVDGHEHEAESEGAAAGAYELPEVGQERPQALRTRASWPRRRPGAPAWAERRMIRVAEVGGPFTLPFYRESPLSRGPPLGGCGCDPAHGSRRDLRRESSERARLALEANVACGRGRSGPPSWPPPPCPCGKSGGLQDGAAVAQATPAAEVAKGRHPSAVVAHDRGSVRAVAELLATAAAHEQEQEVASGPSPEDLHWPTAPGIDGDEHVRLAPFVTVILGGPGRHWSRASQGPYQRTRSR